MFIYLWSNNVFIVLYSSACLRVYIVMEQHVFIILWSSVCLYSYEEARVYFFL